MELEMVLNELSLQPLSEDVLTARQRMLELISTMSTATRSGVNKVLRTHRDLGAEELAPGYPIVQWRNDHKVDRDVRRFFTSLTTKAPYLADIDDDTINGKVNNAEFFHEEKSTTGLGVAYLLDTLALSIRSASCWYPNRLEIRHTYLNNDGEILEEIVTVTHASHKEHIFEHDAWIKERISTNIYNGSDVWQRREQLFPNLQFCESAGEALQFFNFGNSPFSLVIKKLLELEKFCVQWQEHGGAFDLKNIPLTGSVESESALKIYAKEHTFRCPDGIMRPFSLHIRITRDWRLHYYPVTEKQQLIIGYIGEHLPTKKFS